MTIAQRAGVTIVGAYQMLLAPFAGGACRFEPSCSDYARIAIETHGLARGSWLALRRVTRCHPFGAAGFDPVPPSSTSQQSANVPEATARTRA